MLTREELIRIKEERGLTIEQIAKGSGVPVGTLNKILTGQTKQPRTATMQAIEKALCGDTLVRLLQILFVYATFGCRLPTCFPPAHRKRGL